MAALRCLKRRLARRVYASMKADAAVSKGTDTWSTPPPLYA